MTSSKRKVLDGLWTQMIEKGDFPSLSHSIQNIVATVQSPNEHLEKLVSAVVADFTLTQKVLRLANSAMYAPFGGNVTTVSRAVLVLGQETIGHLALGLRLIDSFKGMSADREKARKALTETVLSGHIARKLSEHTGIKEGEEAVVSALLARVGELVCLFYAPDAWSQIEERIAAGATPDDAAEAALGVTLTEIGQEIARRWGLPEPLREVMQPFDPDGVQEPLSHAGWLSAVAAYSHEVARAIHDGEEEAVAAATERYAPLLALDPDTARDTIDALVAERQVAGGWDGLVDTALAAQPQHPGKPPDAEQRLAAGLAEIARSARECHMSVLLHMTLEVIHNSLGCARSIAFVVDPQSGGYSARAMLGELPTVDASALAFEGGFAPDVFHLTLSSRKPVHIADTGEAKIAPRIPAWHRETLGDARSLVLLPLAVRGRPVALVYGDWTREAVPALTQPETELLRDIVWEVERGLLPSLYAAVR